MVRAQGREDLRKEGTDDTVVWEDQTKVRGTDKKKVERVPKE